MSYISNINKAWEVVPFGKLVRRSQYGLSESATADGVPYLKMSNIRDGKVFIENADRLQMDDKTFEEYALQDGDLLFNRTNSLDLVGKTGVFRGVQKVVFASYLVRFQVHERKADSNFIAAWFASSGAAHRLRCLATPGVSQSNINPTTLRLAMHVPCPPLHEQRKIAEILTTWDEALEKLDALIEAKERSKKALMQQQLNRAAAKSGRTHARHRLGEVVERVTRKNARLNDRVLTISAQGGLVDQREYFNRNVAGADLSGYYLLKNGEFALQPQLLKGLSLRGSEAAGSVRCRSCFNSLSLLSHQARCTRLFRLSLPLLQGWAIKLWTSLYSQRGRSSAWSLECHSG